MAPIPEFTRQCTHTQPLHPRENSTWFSISPWCGHLVWRSSGRGQYDRYSGSFGGRINVSRWNHWRLICLNGIEKWLWYAHRCGITTDSEDATTLVGRCRKTEPNKPLAINKRPPYDDTLFGMLITFSKNDISLWNKFSSKPVHITYPHAQFEEDWMDSGYRISYSKIDGSPVWPNTATTYW